MQDTSKSLAVNLTEALQRENQRAIGPPALSHLCHPQVEKAALVDAQRKLKDSGSELGQ